MTCGPKKAGRLPRLRPVKPSEYCDCEMCEFARTFSAEIVDLEEVNGLVIAVLEDGSRILTPVESGKKVAVN